MAEGPLVGGSTTVPQLLALAAPDLRQLGAGVPPRELHRAARRLLLGHRLRQAGVELPADDPLRPGSVGALGAVLGGELDAVLDRHLPAPPPHPIPLPSPARLAQLHQDLEAGASDRKDRGSFFTQAPLVRTTIRRALEELPPQRRSDCRLLDPAAGAGAFLIEALDLLGGADRARRRELASHQLLAIERDPVTASVARWCLWLAVGAPDRSPAEVAPGIACADALLSPATAPFAMGSFDAVVGNPPWETVQPMCREFFADGDPGFVGLERRTANARMAKLLSRDTELAGAWDRHREQIRDLSRWVRSSASPYRYQGPGKLYTYRLFVERSWHWLAHGGVLGMVLPGGIYLDAGAADLRRMLLDSGQWHWLYGFENRQKMFPIDSRYRFAAVVATKGGRTAQVRTAFHRHTADEWERGDGVSAYPRAWVRRLSPTAECFVEIRQPRDLELLARLHARGEPFVGDGRPLTFAQGDFNMTSHVDSFVPRARAEAEGWGRRRSEDDQRWHHPERPGAMVPLFQGAMVWGFHPFAAGHDGGGGHGARWARRDAPRLRPQYLVPEDLWHRRRPRAAAPSPDVRAVFRTLSNATNERTAVAATLVDAPSGNSLGCLSAAQPDDLVTPCVAAAVMGSLVYDWSLRQRLGGTNLNRFVLEDTVWPCDDLATRRQLAGLVARLTWLRPGDQRAFELGRRQGWLAAGAEPAHCATARADLTVQLDLMVARAWGLTADDLRWILRDCDHPAAALGDRTFTSALDPKGFWRVDRKLPVERRHTVRLLAAMT